MSRLLLLVLSTVLGSTEGVASGLHKRIRIAFSFSIDESRFRFWTIAAR